MIAIVGIHYRNYVHYTLYRSCLLIYGIAIIRLLSIFIFGVLKEIFLSYQIWFCSRSSSNV